MTSENRSLMNAFKTWWKCLSINSLEIMHENKSISGYHLGVLLNNPSFIKTALKDIHKLFNLYEEGKIKIRIDSTYPYSKIGEAMKRMHSRLNVGKIILKPDSEYQPPAASEAQAETTTDQVKLISTEPLSVEEKLPFVQPTTTQQTEQAETTQPETLTAETGESSKTDAPTIEVPEPVSA